MDYYWARRLRTFVVVAIVLGVIGWIWHAFFWDALPIPELPDIPGLSAGGRGESPDDAAPRRAAENPPLYKWKDDQGRWNVTDRPPPDRPYEKVVVDPDTNVIPSLAPPADERKTDD